MREKLPKHKVMPGDMWGRDHKPIIFVQSRTRTHARVIYNDGKMFSIFINVGKRGEFFYGLEFIGPAKSISDFKGITNG